MATTGDGAVRRDHPSDLQFLVNSAPSLIHTSRPDGYLDFFNQTWLTYVGRSLEDLQGWKWTAFIHPEDVEVIVEKWRLALASGEPFLHEARVLRADGEYRWMLHHKVAARDGDGQIIKWVGSSIDIEEIKRTEAKLQKSEEYLSEAQRLSHTGSFGWKVSTGEIFWSDETFRIFECDPKAKPTLEFVLSQVHPDDRELVQQQIERAIRDGAGFECEHHLQLPHGSVKHVRVTAHSSRDSVGNIEFVGAVTDITDQKRAEESVRESEAYRERAELYLEEGQRLAHTGSWAFGEAGFEYWSSELFQIYGLDPSGEPPTLEEYLNLVHPEDREFMEQGIQKMLADHRQFDFTKRIVRPDGKTRFVRCVGIPRTHGETFLGFVGTGMDVTEQEQLADELRRSEAFLLEAQRLSRTGSWRHDLQSGTVKTSPEMLEVFGVEPDEDYSSAEFWLNRIHPEDRKRVQEIFERSEAQKTNYEADYRIVLPDGSIKYQHSIGHPVLNESGQVVEFVGTAMDVTAQHLDKVALKNAFDEIKKSEADLLEAQRLSHMGSWQHDVLKGIVTISPEVHRIFDIRSGEDASSAGFFFSRIHSEDQPIEAQNYERATLAKTDFESDYRIVLPDGSIRHVHNVGHPVLNESGDIREFVGTVIDITERKAAEEKIREQEMEFRQILDFAPWQVAVLGADGKAIYLNKAGLDYHGLTRDAWQGYDPHRLIHPDDHDRILTGAGGAKLLSGEPFENEARLLRKDGKYRWFLFQFNPLRDGEGHIRRWYVTNADIEDRKQTEERLQNENVALREEIDKASMFEEIVGTSKPLKVVLSRIAKVAPTDSTVLITGETGTGKELIARAVHKRSRRSGHPFVSVNCAALPPTLVSSELFGHEKGAFTGATQRRLGRFEMAEGGTIFLDEVGELLPDTQAALLRVIQEREFERVGGGQPIHIDVRVIAATNRDLNAAVANGAFRQDLLYRLNVFPIEMPSLRERRDDILMLVEYFVQRYANRAGRIIRSIEKKTLDLLQSYDWPGNIRELQNVIERSIILSSADVFSVDELWLSKRTSPRAVRVHASPALPALNVEPRSEREIIEAALAETRGRVSGSSGAAAKLRIPASTLETRIKALKINKQQFKFG